MSRFESELVYKNGGPAYINLISQKQRIYVSLWNNQPPGSNLAQIRFDVDAWFDMEK
uniref:Ycf48-like protein n=1 Tax=Heterorhabditis bacteriophora TaxID=37862 RepID=A0A1I7XA97_HETBA